MKYQITEAQAVRLRRYFAPFVQPDRHARSGDGSYTIASLYWDAPDLLLHRQTLEGIKSRYKLRVRCYSDDRTQPVFLEIKFRRNAVISKLRAAVPRAAQRQCLAGWSGSNRLEVGPGGEEFQRLVQLIGARPTVLVRYRREAYVGVHDDRIRVTFDRKIMSAAADSADVRCGGAGWSPVTGRSVVLELKFTGRCPSWMAEAIERFELVRQSYSKYSNSVLNEQRVGSELGA